jgi:NIPSNAP
MAAMDDKAPEQLVEFRNYQILPGAIEAFVEHFENHFLESQEELGMDIVGQFRVVDDTQRFVWIRRYLEPSSRGTSLRQFYTGPVWKEFGPRANELMVDHTDVHLLIPHSSASAFAPGHVPHVERRGDPAEPVSTVVAAFFEVDEAHGLSPATVSQMATVLEHAPGVAELGRLVTAAIPNDFAPLPVHEDRVALWLLSDYDHGEAAVAVAEAIGEQSDLQMRTLRLTPTARSTLR